MKYFVKGESMLGIIYFSGTGNSKWLSEEVFNLAKERNIESKIISIEEGRGKVEEIFHESDKLVIVYPIYGSDMPKIQKKILLNLKKNNMTKTMLLCTQLSFSGDANMHFRKVFRRNNLNVSVLGEFNMSNNICTPIFKEKPLTGQKLSLNLKKNKEKLEKLFDKFIHNEEVLKEISFGDTLGGTGQRIGFNLLYPLYHKFFTTNEKCTKCGYCEKICPVGCVKIKDNKVKWNNKCIFCARCYNTCSVDGINLMKDTIDNEKYPRYKGPRV